MARKREERAGKIKPQPCTTDTQSSSSPPAPVPPTPTTPPPAAPTTPPPSMVVHGTAPLPVFADLRAQLAPLGLTLREIPGDGNCLFGALADQVDGSRSTHGKHRKEVVSYMRQNRQHFEPFVEDEMNFSDHLKRLSEMGTFGGNECIVAFARLHSANVVIHQVNTPLWRISGFEGSTGHPGVAAVEVHISYHNGDHYNSVRHLSDHLCEPANVSLLTSLAKPDAPHRRFRLEAQLTRYTGCEDPKLVSEFLRRANYNVDVACEALVLRLNGTQRELCASFEEEEEFDDRVTERINKQQSLSLAQRRELQNKLYQQSEGEETKEVVGGVSRLGI